MLVRRVIGHDIEDEPDATGMQLIEQTIKVFEGAEEWIDIRVIGNIVAEIEHRRAIYRGQPDRTDSQPREMIYSRKNTRQIADPVSIRILIGPRADLINRAT